MRPVVRWAAWGALAVGLLNAAVSAYWALGGTAGLDSLGGQLEQMAHARQRLPLLALWVVVAVKIAAAALGVMLLRAESPGWRRLLLTGTWIAAGVLVVYGGTLVAGQTLVVTGVVQASPAAPPGNQLRATPPARRRSSRSCPNPQTRRPRRDCSDRSSASARRCVAGPRRRPQWPRPLVDALDTRSDRQQPNVLNRVRRWAWSASCSKTALCRLLPCNCH